VQLYNINEEEEKGKILGDSIYLILEDLKEENDKIR